jgi:hypothetical protein
MEDLSLVVVRYKFHLDLFDKRLPLTGRGVVVADHCLYQAPPVELREFTDIFILKVLKVNCENRRENVVIVIDEDYLNTLRNILDELKFWVSFVIKDLAHEFRLGV